MFVSLIAALDLVASAAPTHAQIDSASFATVTTATDKDAGEITISKATISGVECYRGTAKTDLAPSKLLSVVADVEGAPRWSSAGVTEAKLLQGGSSYIEYYQYLDVPGWTMSSDRFWFLSSTLENTDARASLKWTPLQSGGKHNTFWQQVKTDHPDAVEPPVNVGSWMFERTSEGVTVRYSICTLPGGSIPIAIQNAATRKTLPATVGDVIREARRR